LTLLTDLPAAARQGWAFCYKFPKEEKQMASTGLVSTVQKMANDIKNTCMVWAEDSVVQREIAKGQLRDLPKRLYPKVKVVFMVCILTAQLFGLNARAQDNTSVSAPLSKGKKFAGEIGYQIHSLPLDGVALLGPSLTYQLTSTGALGTRMLLSPGDANERRVAVFWRFSWSRKYYVWLIEPHYSYLWQGSSGSQFSATGVAGGLQYKVSPDLLVGAIVGLERSGPFFPFGPIWDRPSFILSTTFQF
jgi:hypothetical protein